MPGVTSEHGASFRVAAHVSWAPESCGIRVVDRQTNGVRVLDYPRAAVWDCVARGRTYVQALRLLCALYPVDESGAERMVLQCLSEWMKWGLVTRVNEHD